MFSRLLEIKLNHIFEAEQKLIRSQRVELSVQKYLSNNRLYFGTIQIPTYILASSLIQ